MTEGFDKVLIKCKVSGVGAWPEGYSICAPYESARVQFLALISASC